MRVKKYLKLVSVFATFLVIASSVDTAMAAHRWGSYHWGRAAGGTLVLADNVSPEWDVFLSSSSGGWNNSHTLNTSLTAGSNRPRSCRAVKGRVEVCSAKYGRTRWLGVTRLWVDRNGHITQATTKFNDTYFASPAYNNSAWRSFVSCHELGHTLGLAHQDENFYNSPLGSCMDYTIDPTPNQTPNQHDYDILHSIYAHADSTSTLGAVAIPPSNLEITPLELQKATKNARAVRHQTYESQLPNKGRLITHVTWIK